MDYVKRQGHGFTDFSQFLLSEGFVMCRADNSLFVCHTPTSVTILLVYVDDIFLTKSNSSVITKLLAALHNQFSMRHLRELKHFLGMEFIKDHTCIKLSQEQYIVKLLHKVRMTSCKACPTSIVSKHIFENQMDTYFEDSKLYRSLVGGLQYLTITRPDITYAINYVCQHMHK